MRQRCKMLPMPHATTMFQARPGYASDALCFAGTKVRVETLFNYLCDGGTVDGFLDEFEGAVSREQAISAIETAAREFVDAPERIRQQATPRWWRP